MNMDASDERNSTQLTLKRIFSDSIFVRAKLTLLVGSRSLSLTIESHAIERNFYLDDWELV